MQFECKSNKVYFEEDDTSDEVVSSVFNITAHKGVGPVLVTMNIHQKKFRLLLDTGASYTLMGK